MNSPRHVLILADIEGCSGCRDRAGSAWLTTAWVEACAAMTADVNAVIAALAAAGVEQITVQDFHRTGFNLWRDHLPAWVEVRQGYRPGPVPGLGTAPAADAVMLLGMHAASGTAGFLPHTLTSRIRHLTLNGTPVAEVQLFTAALAERGIRPLFFSGCPVACAQAAAALPGIAVWPIHDEERTPAAAPRWRTAMAQAAAAALTGFACARPYDPPGPLTVEIGWRGGTAATRAVATKWHLPTQDHVITLSARTLTDIYRRLVQICYLEPWQIVWLPVALRLYRVLGRLGLALARRWLQ